MFINWKAISKLCGQEVKSIKDLREIEGGWNPADDEILKNETAASRLAEAYELVKGNKVPYGNPEFDALTVIKLEKRRLVCGHPIACLQVNKEGRRDTHTPNKCGWCEDREQRFASVFEHRQEILNYKQTVELLLRDRVALGFGWVLAVLLYMMNVLLVSLPLILHLIGVW